jgi:hypothetical protein
MGAGLARAENTSSSGSSLTSPGVAATVYAICAPRAPARASVTASCAQSSATSSTRPFPAGAPAAGAVMGMVKAASGAAWGRRAFSGELGDAAAFAGRGPQWRGGDEKAGGLYICMVSNSSRWR